MSNASVRARMELKRDPVHLAVVLNACLDRVTVLAERKGSMLREPVPEVSVTGDRELLEVCRLQPANQCH